MRLVVPVRTWGLRGFLRSSSITPAVSGSCGQRSVVQKHPLCVASWYAWRLENINANMILNTEYKLETCSLKAKATTMMAYRFGRQ